MADQRSSDKDAPELMNPGMMAVASRLYESRTILLSGEINSKVAREVSAQLLALAAESKEDITFFIHSPGGHVESGDTIHDMVKFIEPRVRMIGTGWVASAGTHIYLAVPVEDRLCLPNTRFMIHQPRGGVGGTTSDIRIEALELVKARDRLIRVIAEGTGQPIEKVRKDTERNHWMSPEEAVDYGLVGRIVSRAAELAA